MELVPLDQLPSAVQHPQLATPTQAWLASKRLNTQLAYRRSLRTWLVYCIEHDIDPLAARKVDADLFGAQLREPTNERRPLSAASAALVMSAVSSWYAYLVACEETTRNPFTAAERLPVDRDFSATSWLSLEQAQLLLQAAARWNEPFTLRNTAMLRVLIELGLRVTEVANLRCEDLIPVNGERAVLIRAKGGKRVRRALPPRAASAIDAYLASRALEAGVEPDALSGPLFVSKRGAALKRDAIARVIQHIAALTVIQVDVTPHVLRHTFATIATTEGSGLDELQASMGHADPRTTRRYQRAVNRLENDPAHRVSDALG